MRTEQGAAASTRPGSSPQPSEPPTGTRAPTILTSGRGRGPSALAFTAERGHPRNGQHPAAHRARRMRRPRQGDCRPAGERSTYGRLRTPSTGMRGVSRRVTTGPEAGAAATSVAPTGWRAAPARSWRGSRAGWRRSGARPRGSRTATRCALRPTGPVPTYLRRPAPPRCGRRQRGAAGRGQSTDSHTSTGAPGRGWTRGAGGGFTVRRGAPGSGSRGAVLTAAPEHRRWLASDPGASRRASLKQLVRRQPVHGGRRVIPTIRVGPH